MPGHLQVAQVPYREIGHIAVWQVNDRGQEGQAHHRDR
jgi:hypothetical protein